MIARLRVAPGPGPMDAVLRRLAARRPLTPAETEIVGDVARQRVRERAGNELASASGGVTPRFLLSGWAAHQSVLSDGRRQLHRLLLAGDIFGLQSDIGRPGDQVVALTDVVIADATPIVRAARSGDLPMVAAAITQAERDHQRLILNSIVRMGRMTAYERVAHLLLELRDRLAVVQAGDAHRFPLPLTQQMLSDMLGLSIVHTNRVLQRLRRERLIELRSGVAVLLDTEVLAAIARGDGDLGQVSLPRSRETVERSSVGAH
ncbi:MAG: transcriptional regulator, Crp/Fnr family [Phenylobacterium sp.]|nr:transcriptional regulator, Crp/Fnr family [Phenylobacterium sp.]